MNVLVTGATGRLGPYVVRDLEEAGHKVTLFSRKKPSGEQSGAHWLEGCIDRFEDCLRATKGHFDAIQHCAAQAWPTDRLTLRTKASDLGLSPGHTLQTNIMGTYNMLQAAVDNNINTFIMTGSNCTLGSIYRITDHPFIFKYLPVDEQHPSEVEDSYSFSKLVDEQLLELYSRVHGLRCHSIRAAGICDGDRRTRMLNNAKPTDAWSTGLFAWVASEDVASAQRLLMEKANEIPAFGTYYCNNDDTSCLEPTLALIEKIRPDLIQLLSNEIQGHEALISNKKLKATAGWIPKHSWRDAT